MAKVTINGQGYEFNQGMTILQVCAQNGIKVPTFCNDPRLKPGGTCRICVVEIEGRPNLMPSCAVSAADGMVVQTESGAVVAERKAILEKLMAGHGTNCGECPADQACKLQEYGAQYGAGDFKGTAAPKITFQNEFIQMDASKCIRCQLCVKVAQNLQVCNALSVQGKITDADFAIKYDVDKCVSCGNCAFVCPVGALTVKGETPFKVNELTKTRTTCPFCGVGCQVDYYVKNNKIVKSEPVMDATNKGQLCVKGRFAYDYASSSKRLTVPLIKKDGKFVESTWAEAYDLIVAKFSEAKAKYGTEKMGVLASAKISNEDNYLAQKFARVIFKNNNVDICARL